MEKNDLLKKSINGDINAFQELFSAFQANLKSYLYRLVTDRNDAEDLTHDCFVKAFDHIGTFKGASSLKTWVFTIATRLAYDHQRTRKRWTAEAQDYSKALAMSNADVSHAIMQTNQASGENAYEIREHIDFCFTCISKTLPIEQQVALILKDIYDFTVKDICMIMEQTEGVVKHLLIDSRKTMTGIFEHRCALINKNGVCNQCSELNGVLNPKQNRQEALMKIDLAKASSRFNREELYTMRTQLVKAIDPLRGQGADIQDIIMKCTRMAIGEIKEMR